MNKNKISLINKKGAALVFVIAAILVASIMIAAVAQMAQANTKQASAQEKGMQAYYIAKSGAEIAYQALNQTGKLTAINSNTLQPETLGTVTFGAISAGGIATISFAKKTVSSKVKVVITSIGTLTQSNVSRTVKLEVFANYTTDTAITWTN